MRLKTGLTALTVVVLVGSCDTNGEAPVDTDSPSNSGYPAGDTDPPSNDVPNVINGTVDRDGIYPSVVKVLGEGTCTGSVVAPDTVLTAAHCVCRKYTDFGGTEREDAASCRPDAKVVFKRSESPASMSIVVTGSVVVHPDYVLEFDSNGYVASSVSDIAVVVLDTCAPDWSPTLPVIDGFVSVGDAVTLVGYGLDECDGTTAGTRRFGDSELASYSEEFLRVVADAEQGDPITWRGDSGGPLLVDGRVAGVLSKGTCSDTGSSSATFTNAWTYSLWIESKLGSGECQSTMDPPDPPTGVSAEWVAASGLLRPPLRSGHPPVR